MLSDPSTVDRTTLDELTGKLVLLIDESRPWHDAKPMHRQLSAKVRHYVRYILSEAFASEHGQRPQDTIVRLVSAEPPTEGSLEFFQRIGYELGKNGIEFEYQVGEHGIPIAVAPGVPVAAHPLAPPLPVKERLAEPAGVPKESADVPEAIEASEVVEAPEAMEAPEVIEAPEAPEAMEVPEVIAAPEAPEAAEVSEPAPVPELAGLPEFSDAEAVGELEEAFDAFEDIETSEPLDAGEVTEPTDLVEPAPPEEVVSAPSEPDATPSLEQADQLEESPLAEEEWESQYVDEEPSELERLIEAPDEEESIFIDLEQPAVVAAEEAPPKRPDKAEQTYPPFFPEEEFGRALPDYEQVESILGRTEPSPREPAVIETSSGKKILVDVPARTAKRTAAEKEGGASIRRAVGAAIGAAIAGALVWGILAIPAAQGASPLAVAVALMVGMSVRLRGGGETTSFRVVGCLGTIFGSVLGALLALAALTGWVEGQGPQGVVNMFTNPANLLAALETYFSLVDLASLAIALYIAFRISAARAAD